MWLTPVQYILFDGFLSFGLALIFAGWEFWKMEVLRRKRRVAHSGPS